jgi:hypothetical protein
MKLKSLFFIIPWSFFTAAVLITWFTNLEFNERWLKMLSTFIFTGGIPFVFILNTSKGRTRKALLLILSAVLLAATAVLVRISEVIHFGTGFKTQTVLYRMKSNPERRIEFQMEDVGALGYNRRTVEITPCFYFFSSWREVDENAVDTTKWRYVNEAVNEIGLKGG